MRLSRRAVIAGSAGLVAAPAVLRITKLHAAEFTLKYANNSPINHPLTVRSTEAMKAIREETNGKVEIGVFPNSQLGTDTDMLSQLRSGALEFFTLSPLILSTLVPKASISGIGFAWSSYDKVWPAMDGELGSFVRGQIQKSGLYAFEKIFDNGFRQITSSTKPVLTPQDLNGFKIRVPVSPLWTSMFKAFESAPMSINFAETYLALRTKIADGQENPLPVIDTAKLYEVQKYLSLTNHMWDGYWFLTSQRVWSRLPKEVQTVIEKHINQASMIERDDISKLSGTLQSSLKQNGMEITEVKTGPFRDKLQSSGFYKEWRQTFGEDTWVLLEKYAGAIS